MTFYDAFHDMLRHFSKAFGPSRILARVDVSGDFGCLTLTKMELSLSRFQPKVVPPSHARFVRPPRLGLVVGGYVEVILLVKLALIYLLLSSLFLTKHICHKVESR